MTIEMKSLATTIMNSWFKGKTPSKMEGKYQTLVRLLKIVISHVDPAIFGKRKTYSMYGINEC